MATGDQADVFARLKANIVDWFGNDTPNLDALLQGIAKTDSTIYQLILSANIQTRIQTAKGEALDLISLDYFGNDLPRHVGENDKSFRNRILANLLLERATRQAMIDVLTQLTGRAPAVIEGTNPVGIGAYDQSLYYDNGYSYGWSQPYTAIIYVYRPQPTGLQGVGSYDAGQGHGFGYDYLFNNAYVSNTEEIVTVSDQDILDIIERTKVFGTFIYTTIFD